MKLIHRVLGTDVSGCGFYKHGEPCPFRSQAESNWEQTCLRATEMQWVWVPASSSHSYAFSLLIMLLHCCLPLPPPAFFLAPVLQILEQQSCGKIKIVSCNFNVLKRQSLAKREGEARQEGSRESPHGFSCLEAVPPGSGLQLKPACRGWRMCLLGLPVPGQLLSWLLLAFIRQSKLIQLFSLAKKISLWRGGDVVVCHFYDLKCLTL